jgi:hypothetical protein
VNGRVDRDQFGEFLSLPGDEFAVYRGAMTGDDRVGIQGEDRIERRRPAGHIVVDSEGVRAEAARSVLDDVSREDDACVRDVD